MRGAARPDELDSAEAVRVAIARALAHQPKLLVIDEPMMGVDLLARDGILALLRSLADEGHRRPVRAPARRRASPAPIARCRSIDGELHGSCRARARAGVPAASSSQLGIERLSGRSSSVDSR